MTLVHAALLLRTVAAFEPATALASRSTRLRRDLRLASLRAHERCFASATDKSEDTKTKAEADVMVDAKLPSNEDEDGKLLRIRHSTAHVMAMAVQKLFKGTKGAVPTVEHLLSFSLVTCDGRSRAARQCPSARGLRRASTTTSTRPSPSWRRICAGSKRRWIGLFR